MNEMIFREYDIRGIYPEELDDNTAYIIGKSFASYITTDKKVIIGHDNRLSSPQIYENLKKGLLESGAHIYDLHLCSTPMYNVTKKLLGFKNGIMITASHNPKEYNGFKISFDYFGSAYNEKIKNFKDFTLEGNFIKKEGRYFEIKDKEKIYISRIKKAININRNKKLKVIYDMGNGTASIIVDEVLKNFNIDYKILYGESDGNFPNHHPDPFEEENLKDLKEEVIKENADIGIGIDGDGDRVGIIDNKGNFIPMDKIITLLYKYLYPNMTKKEALVGIKCSSLVKEELSKIDMPVTYYKISSYLNHRVNTENFEFAGELSGHLWFNDIWPGVDDGIFAGLKIIEMLSYSDKDLNSLLNELEVYYNTPEIKMPIEEDKKDKFIDKMKEFHDKNHIKYNNIDGLRIEFKDGFALIRKSNTSPYITMRFEKKTEEELNELKEYYLNLAKKISSELN